MTCCVNRLLSWILFGTSFIVRYVQRNHNTYQGRAKAGEEGDYIYLSLSPPEWLLHKDGQR